MTDPMENLLARKRPVATWAEPTHGAVSDETQLCIDWGASAWGWGMLTFHREGDRLVCDNECMSRRFCKTVLAKLVEGFEGRELPPLLGRFPSLDALLEAAEPKNPAPDWPSHG
jgi:hypothetical protein